MSTLPPRRETSTSSSSEPVRRGSPQPSTLHRAGRDVLVIDKAVFPRDKCCGDGLTTLALRELEGARTPPRGGRRMVRRRRSLAPIPRRPRGRGAAALPTAGTPPSHLRQSLDHATPAAGAVGRRRGPATAAASVRSTPATTNSYPSTSRDDHDRARPIRVAADGMWSPVRKAVGATIDGYRGEWHAFRQYARNVTGPASERLDRLVRARPAARLRLVVPAARQPGQHRLRRAP